MSHKIGQGVAVSEETLKQYSSEVQQAWETFDHWWKKARQDLSPNILTDRTTIPDHIIVAMNLICDTPIPGTKGLHTGADSRYMFKVKQLLID